MSSQTVTIDTKQIKVIFEKTFYMDYKVILCYGFNEPYYLASNDRGESEIRCRENFVRSALHEIAHWCVAGSSRRKMDDYGYWYKADGRTNAEQQVFYQVEVLPQAYEKLFCLALDLNFEVSADNLTNPEIEGSHVFAIAVDKKYNQLKLQNLPVRVAKFNQALQDFSQTLEL